MFSAMINTSLIISTYNWPEALKLCLLSVAKQTILPTEIIIADDGSTEKTKHLITTFQQDLQMPIIHVWQPDEGFQLARIRNKAIAASQYEYIIQIDGDLILHPKFIADHISFSKPGSFVSGSRVILDKTYSEKLLNTGATHIDIFDNGVKNKSNGLRINFLRNVLAKKYKQKDIMYLRGCNMAFWREDLFQINGYNENFTGWGREDNEIAVRLINNDIEKRIIKFGGIVYHIYHEEKPRNILETNDFLLQKTINKKLKKTSKGLDQYSYING